MKYYNSPLFFWKMGFLAAALAVTFALAPRLRVFDDNASRVIRGSVGLVSLVLWFAAGTAGRAIAFF
jgi:hypothetical protein